MFFRVLRCLSIISCYLQSLAARVAESAAARQLYYCTYDPFTSWKRLPFQQECKELLPGVLRNNRGVDHDFRFSQPCLMEMMRMQRSNSISPIFSVFHRAAALFLAALMVPAGWAQDSSSVPAAPSAQTQNAIPSASQPFDVMQYSRPRSAFPNVAAPFSARQVQGPNLANTPRIDQLMRNGKLYISMNDAVALALENNLDIGIARYNLNIADTDVWRAKAGSVTLGVNTGIVQGTPGGTGVGVGSTSSGGGAGG